MQSASSPVIDVCAAVIRRGSDLLLAKRAGGTHLGGHWEFPGGKVNDGESLDVCIRREIREELGAEVSSSRHVRTVEHWYTEKSIRLHFFECELTPDSGLQALEHESIGWYNPEQAGRLNLAPADRRFLRWYCAQ